MNEKKTGSMRRKGTISDTIVHVLLAVLAVIWVIPILWIVLLSFSSQKGSYVTTFFPERIYPSQLCEAVYGYTEP